MSYRVDCRILSSPAPTLGEAIARARAMLEAHDYDHRGVYAPSGTSIPAGTHGVRFR